MSDRRDHDPFAPPSPTAARRTEATNAEPAYTPEHTAGIAAMLTEGLADQGATTDA